MQSDNMLLLTASLDFPPYDPTPALHFLIPNEDAVTMATINETSSNNSATDFANSRDENLAKIEIAVQALIFVLAVFGNGFVLLALRYRKRKTSRMHIFITHLSIADMLVALLNILPQMAWDITFRFYGSDVSCRVVKYFQVMVIYLSTYILVMTAIDRYRAICHPLSTYSWTNRKSYMLIGLAWLIAMVLSTPQLVIFKMQEVHPGSDVMDCWADFHPEWTLRLYITVFAVTVFLLPSLVLCILYGRICYVVWRNVYHRMNDNPEQCIHSNHPHNVVNWPENGTVRYKFTGTGQIAVIPENSRSNTRLGAGLVHGRSHGVTGISRAKIKTIKLTIVVIIAYMLCWAPFIVTQMWWAYDETAPYNNSTFVICLLLSSLNSCCNPWIYMAFSESLVQQIFPCCRKPVRRKPPDYHYPRERMRFTSTPKMAENGAESEEEDKREDIPLQERIRNEDLRRKSTLMSRTTSTKLSTMYRADSRSSKYNNVIMKYSREHGIIAAANIANWPCATVYGCQAGHDKHACAIASRNARAGTKGCQCKKCAEAMEDKMHKKGFLSSWREKTEEKAESSSSSSKRKTSKDRDSKGKRLKLHSDNSHPFLSYKSFGEELAAEGADGNNDVRLSSV